MSRPLGAARKVGVRLKELRPSTTGVLIGSKSSDSSSWSRSRHCVEEHRFHQACHEGWAGAWASAWCPSSVLLRRHASFLLGELAAGFRWSVQKVRRGERSLNPNPHRPSVILTGRLGVLWVPQAWLFLRRIRSRVAPRGRDEEAGRNLQALCELMRH